jgi:RNA polymerase subunit RPABC4/transcription elongation factor Spt4
MLIAILTLGMRGMSCNYKFPGYVPILYVKNQRKKNDVLPRRILSFFVAISLFTAVFSFISIPSISASEIESRVEPVIVYGSDLPGFIGKSVDELWIYAYLGDNWEQIPFQIDERNDVNGSYFFNSEDGFLDANDEIVFMPADCGTQAPAGSRVPNTEPQRYRIWAQDPLDFSDIFAYIYSSDQISKTFSDDYVDFHQNSNKIEASFYSIGFNATNTGVIDEIRVNTSGGGDNIDVLDRFKYRFQKTVEITPDQYHEEDFNHQVVGIIDGPVRVIQKIIKEKVTNDFTFNVNETYFAYGSYMFLDQEMSTNTSTDWVQITWDFLSTVTPITYYDSNSNELIIDGTPETPGVTDTPSWYEVTGTHGTLVALGNISDLGGTSSLYYSDDSSSMDSPEFDFGEHGNLGLSATNPPQSSNIDFSYYFIGSNQQNIGQNYLNYTQNPIVITITSQVIDPSPPPGITGIVSIPDPQELIGPVNITAIVQDNLNEVFSVYVNITDPEDIEIGNFSMEYDSSTNRYYYEREYDIKGTYNFIIWTRDNNGNWNNDIGQFVLRDTFSPEILNTGSYPAQKGVGENVNISSNIEDIVDVYGAWINIRNPQSAIVGNFSMEPNPGAQEYYHNDVYNMVGIYTFTIWTNDTSDNWNLSEGQFEIQDTLDPSAYADSDQAVKVNTIVVFDGSDSADNVGIINYTWTFTDGTQKTLYGDNPSYRFQNPGNFMVNLKVTDSKGNWNIDSMWVNVTEIINNGTISGIVTNSDGNPIAGAKVMVDGTSLEATTDGTGNYIIHNVPAGSYDITIDRSGFKTKKIESIIVIAEQTTSDVFVTMSKEQVTSDEESGGFLWVLLIIVIIVVVLLVFLLARPRKEQEIVEEVIEELHFLCPECGALVNYDMKSCPGCGVEFGEGGGEEEVEVIKESPADIYMCPSCGSFVSSQAESCDQCGYDFNEEEETQDEDIEVPEIPAGLMQAPISASKDEDKDLESKEDGKRAPTEIKAKMAKEIKALITENGYEMEEVEVEMELEMEGDFDSDHKKIEAKEILELFKEELKTPESKDDLGSEYETFSKEIDNILGNSKEKKARENDEESEDKE